MSDREKFVVRVHPTLQSPDEWHKQKPANKDGVDGTFHKPISSIYTDNNEGDGEMKLYLVSRVDGRLSWDEYDAFVIRAKTEEDALRVAEKEEKQGKFEARELKVRGEEEIILGSFNAG